MKQMTSIHIEFAPYPEKASNEVKEEPHCQDKDMGSKNQKSCLRLGTLQQEDLQKEFGEIIIEEERDEKNEGDDNLELGKNDSICSHDTFEGAIMELTPLGPSIDVFDDAIQPLSQEIKDSTPPPLPTKARSFLDDLDAVSSDSSTTEIKLNYSSPDGPAPIDSSLTTPPPPPTKANSFPEDLNLLPSDSSTIGIDLHYSSSDVSALMDQFMSTSSLTTTTSFSRDESFTWISQNQTSIQEEEKARQCDPIQIDTHCSRDEDCGCVEFFHFGIEGIEVFFKPCFADSIDFNSTEDHKPLIFSGFFKECSLCGSFTKESKNVDKHQFISAGLFLKPCYWGDNAAIDSTEASSPVIVTVDEEDLPWNSKKRDIEQEGQPPMSMKQYIQQEGYQLVGGGREPEKNAIEIGPSLLVRLYPRSSVLQTVEDIVDNPCKIFSCEDDTTMMEPSRNFEPNSKSGENSPTMVANKR